MSVDPLTKSYPMLTPYQFASNRPIDGVDLDGLEYARAAGNAATENMTARDQSAAYIIPTPAIKPKVKVEQQVMVQDIHGNVINIPESQVQAFDANKIKEYKSIVLENIRTGGIVTSVTYLLSRDEALTFETRKWDNLLISATGIPNAKSSAFPKVNGNIKFPFIPNNSMNKAPLKLNGRVLIVDENLSPSLSKGLSNEGYNVMTFPKGTKDNLIIEFAQQNNAIVMTNNIKDFKKMGITTFEVHESLKTKEKIPEVISKVNNINNQASNQSDLIDKGNNVKIREF